MIQPFQNASEAHASWEASEADICQQRARRLSKAVAQAHRLRILRALLQLGKALCVSECVELLSPLTQPTVSNHLRILRDAEVVVAHKQGHQRLYVVCREALAQSQELLATLGCEAEDLRMREDAMCILALLRDPSQIGTGL